MTSDDEIDYPGEFWQILDLISGYKIEECPQCDSLEYFASRGCVFDEFNMCLVLECHKCRYTEWVRTMTLDYPTWSVYLNRNNA